MTTDPPKRGTPEYEWWAQGALAEVQARKDGRSKAGLAVRSFVDALAKRDHDLTEADIAEHVYQVYALAGRSRWQQVKLLLRLFRDAVR